MAGSPRTGKLTSSWRPKAANNSDEDAVFQAIMAVNLEESVFKKAASGEF